MNPRNPVLAVLLLSCIAACDRGSPVQNSEQITPPPPAPTAAATPEAAPVDYPGSIDVFSRVGAGKGTPVALVADQTITGHHVADRDGELVAFGVRIGTYHGTADGGLRLSLCVENRCGEAEKSVTNAADNDFLVFELPAALSISKGSALQYQLTRSPDATRRVAVWTYPKLDTQAGIVDPSGKEVPMVPRLSMHLR